MSTWAYLDESKQSMRELVARFGAEEQIVKRLEVQEESGSSAYSAEENKKNKKKNRKCYEFGKEGHFKRG